MQEKKSAKKRDYKKESGYMYKKAITLTKPEGIQLDKIISDNGCANLSQLCKKIVKGEVTLY
ncbi:MAG: hypothetical protein RR576_12330 [Oscillospiraceae bacterium]